MSGREKGYRHLRLALRLLLGHRFADVLGDEVVPLKLATGALVHGRLERPELRHGLQLLDGLDSLLQELDVGVALCRLLADGLQRRWVLLQVLGRTAQEVLEIEPVRVRVTGALLLWHPRVNSISGPMKRTCHVPPQSA